MRSLGTTLVFRRAEWQSVHPQPRITDGFRPFYQPRQAQGCNFFRSRLLWGSGRLCSSSHPLILSISIPLWLLRSFFPFTIYLIQERTLPSSIAFGPEIKHLETKTSSATLAHPATRQIQSIRWAESSYGRINTTAVVPGLHSQWIRPMMSPSSVTMAKFPPETQCLRIEKAGCRALTVQRLTCEAPSGTHLMATVALSFETDIDQAKSDASVQVQKHGPIRKGCWKRSYDNQQVEVVYCHHVTRFGCLQKTK